MRMLCLMPMLIVLGGHAQEPRIFQEPKAYPVQRYEAGWNKNPFTLKTAPVVAEAAAFAQDLIIGSFYGVLENPTIVLVNTKTHERFRLKRGESTPAGIRLDEVNAGGAHKATFVQVSLGGEIVKLRYDVMLATASQTPVAAKQPAATKPATSAPGVTRRLQTTLMMSTPQLPK